MSRGRDDVRVVTTTRSLCGSLSATFKVLSAPKPTGQVGNKRRHYLPDNLTLLPLPAACPELNAAENIWQYLRQTYLSNRVIQSYTSYTAILDACQDAWRKLLSEAGRIASIATRDWANIRQSF
jgi:hypothetical protein